MQLVGRLPIGLLLGSLFAAACAGEVADVHDSGAAQPADIAANDGDALAGDGDGGSTGAADSQDAVTPPDAAAPDGAAPDAAADCPPVAPAPGVVQTDRGAVRGVSDGGVTSFKGIPFAAPPTADLRWKPPVPAACWSGVLEADAFGSACLQKDFRIGESAGSAAIIGSEDCLYLSVWAPDAPADPRPVLVYIHGGGNVAGSASQETAGVALFDGQSLAARRDVVVVTIQYRLSALGFLVLPELTGEHTGAGNWGLLDQIAALDWARRNIASFGGDPSNIMIFGESAGAVDVCALLASPLAEGLFHRALMQSGACAATSAAQREAFGEDFVATLGCAIAPDRLACVSALSDEELLAPLKHPFEGGLAGQAGFGPTVDGWVLPDAPLALIASGAHNRLPVVVGANADETQPTIPPGSVTPQMVESAFAMFPAPYPEQLLALYPPGDSPEQAREAWIRATTDAQFVCAARRTAAALRAGQQEPVWRYHFTHTAPPKFGGDKGSFHGLELFYVFGGIERLFSGLVARPEDKAVVAHMQGYWSRFAATGDPNGDGAPAWPLYEGATDPYLEIAVTPLAGDGVRTEACDLWDAMAGAAR